MLYNFSMLGIEIFAPVPSYRRLNVVISGLFSLILAYKRIGKTPNMEKLENTLLYSDLWEKMSLKAFHQLSP